VGMLIEMGGIGKTACFGGLFQQGLAGRGMIATRKPEEAEALIESEYGGAAKFDGTSLTWRLKERIRA